MTTRDWAGSSAGRIQALACSTFATMLRWVSIAALAMPVVPPVYCRKAMSSGPSGTSGSFSPKPEDSALLKVTAPGMLQGGTCLRT